MKRTLLAAVFIASCLAATEASAEEPDETETSSGGPAGALAAVAAAVDVLATMEAAAAGRTDEFGRSIYEFCHDEDFDPRFTPNGRAFCKAIDAEMAAACPEVKAMCQQKKRWWELGSLGIPAWLAWTVLGLVVAAVAFAFVQALLRAGWEGDQQLDLGPELEPAPLEAMQSLPETPAAAILRRAEAALEQGNPREAAILVQLALLRWFDDTGLVRFHPSRTNGEYLRAIRSKNELWSLYRDVAGATDRIRFGDGQVEPGPVAETCRAAKIAVARRPDEEGAAASASALALVALVFSAGTFAGGCTKNSRFYDASPDGMSALPALLRKAGLEVEITRTPLEEIPENAGAVVIPTSAAGFRDLGKGALDTVLNRDLSVVVIDDAFLPQTDQYVPVTATSTSFQVEPPAFSVGIGEDATCGVDLPLLAEAIDPDRIRLPLADFMRWNGEPGRARASGLELELVPVLLPASSTVAGPADTSTSSETALAFAASRIGLDGEYVGGCLFVFSNHHLFTNVSLTREAHLRFVAGFLASLLREGETLYLLESLKTGDAAPSVGRTFGEARLLPFIAQAFAVLIALFIMIGAAFGPLRDPISHAHKAFSEHVQAIGRHYAAAGIKGTTHAAQSLARLLVIRHRHEARGGEGGGWVAVARHLAERYEVDERDVRAALRLGIEGTSELGAPGPDDPAPSSEQMLKTLSALLTQERS